MQAGLQRSSPLHREVGIDGADVPDTLIQVCATDGVDGAVGRDGGSDVDARSLRAAGYVRGNGGSSWRPGQGVCARESSGAQTIGGGSAGKQRGIGDDTGCVGEG